eukprot:TRINITY_DN25006_c1_g1_i1.p2 TRINITY_DN25006_c1_g1~~TRINITY_DN25006_c1_g1_i1.p2  ORF type:complete len:106 (-),score=0.24 TRINITY_DN25006_c1_g1_i1:276-593(-)
MHPNPSGFLRYDAKSVENTACCQMEPQNIFPQRNGQIPSSCSSRGLSSHALLLPLILLNNRAAKRGPMRQILNHSEDAGRFKEIPDRRLFWRLLLQNMTDAKAFE